MRSAGFTKESWKEFQEKEKAKKQPKNLGGLGPRGFKSRSFQSFQEALERGEAAHLMPVFNAKEKLKRGEIKLEDIPYMVRAILTLWYSLSATMTHERHGFFNPTQIAATRRRMG